MADSKLTPVAKDADATVDELHARAAEDYRYGQDHRQQTANEHARGGSQGADMGRLDWLIPGKDHELARTKYPDRESASATARRKEFKPAKSAAEAARLGQKWEDDTR